jgi:hypothetical protein
VMELVWYSLSEQQYTTVATGSGRLYWMSSPQMSVAFGNLGLHWTYCVVLAVMYRLKNAINVHKYGFTKGPRA